MAITFTLPNFGLGGGPLGSTGGNFGVASEEIGIATVQHALAQGITLFDTAPMYGAGVSEARYGKALAGVARDRFRLCTKVGFLVNEQGKLEQSYTGDAVKRSIEASLRRLGLDYIDIVHIHDADGEEHFRQALDEAYPALAELKSQGVIGAISAGMNQWQREAQFARNADFDAFLLAGRYTLLEQEPLHEFFPLCAQKQISILLGGVFNSGILATGATPKALFQYRPAPPAVIEKTRRIEEVCTRHGVALKTAALQFPLAHPVVRTLVVGMVSLAEVDENLTALQEPIPAAFWADLRAEGLLDADAPTP